MAAYRLALALADACWADLQHLRSIRPVQPVVAQLFRAVGSIAANIAEGYSRSSGRDRARLFEYALGSARESIVWYHLLRHSLGRAVVASRTAEIDSIRRLVLCMIATERERRTRLSFSGREPD